MSAILKLFSRSLLALILAISSLQMAVARGAPMPVGEMVLCTGNGPVTVLVDENGEPTGDVQYCPECAAVAFAAVDASAPVLPAINLFARPLEAACHDLLTVQKTITRSNARGPPLSV